MRNSSNQVVGHPSRNAQGLSRIARRLPALAAIVIATIVLTVGGVDGATIPGTYNVSLAWNASSSAGVTGYRVSYGLVSGSYTHNVVVVDGTFITVSGLASGAVYYFAVSAYDSNGLESEFSNEISFLPGKTTSQISFTAGGVPTLKMNGLIGHVYDIEATEDLVRWTKIGSVTVGDGGAAVFQDASAVNFPKRFYRTHDTQP